MKVFDICGTLFYDDTTLGLLAWHFRRRGRWRWWALVWLLFGPLLLFVKVLERASGRHLAKHLALRGLAGETPRELQESARQYVEYLLHRRRIPAVFDRFLEATGQGRAILASASLDPLVGELGERFGVDFVSSQLEIRGERYTGRLARDITGIKERILLERWGSALFGPDSCGYSDNLSDAGLLSRCSQRFAVIHSQRQRRRWRLPGIQFVQAR